MNQQKLVSIASFPTAFEAHSSRNILESNGIQAFVADEDTAGMMWHLTTAIGGVKLMVDASVADQAIEILNQKLPVDSTEAEESTTGVPEPEEIAETPESAEESQPEFPPTLRDQYADRAFRGAIFGLLLVPLQLYVTWLLFKVWMSEERLSPKKQFLAVIAAMINFPYMLGIAFFIKNIFVPEQRNFY